MAARFLGIDFSGNHLMWGRIVRSNVWIADVRGGSGQFALHGLARVTDLPGNHPPFRRLASLLSEAEFDAAAIDAPFSVPMNYLPKGGHQALLERVASLGRSAGRPFPSANDFVELAIGKRPPPSPRKPLRRTELCWQRRGVNGRPSRATQGHP
jgi:hypothetical protein